MNQRESQIAWNDQTIRLEQRRAVMVYVALLLVSVLWLGMIFAAPGLIASGHELAGVTLYRSFSAICHQMPERSLHLHGLPLAVCSRCTAIYAGFFLGLVVSPFVRGLRNQTMPARRWLLWAALPVVVDFSGGWIGLFANTFFSRTATGLLAGAAMSFYLLPSCLAIVNHQPLTTNQLSFKEQD